MKSQWITYNGKRMLYCDYTNIPVADLATLKAELQYVEELICTEPEKSVLSITDVRGSVASVEAVDLMKKAAVSTGKYVHRQAVVGVTGLKKVLFDAIVRISGQDAKTFDDLEQAKAWLAMDLKKF